MDGMRNKRLAQIVLGTFFVSTLLLVASCSQKRVAPERRPPRQEKKVARKGVYHVVERHQTLYRICKTYEVDIHEVASINGITDHSKIQTGQRIFIPGTKKVLKVEIVIDDVAAEPDEKVRITYKKLDFIWPVEGKIA